MWSLQSFYHGGFLCGAPAFVKEDQNGRSVLLCVMRRINGMDRIDKSYEVYSQQVKYVPKREWDAHPYLRKFRKQIIQRSNSINANKPINK